MSSPSQNSHLDSATNASRDRHLDQQLWELAPTHELDAAARARIRRTVTSRMALHPRQPASSRRRGVAVALGALVAAGSIAATSPWWLDMARGCHEDVGSPVAEQTVSDGVVEVMALRADPDAPPTGSMLRHRTNDGSTGIIGSCTPTGHPVPNTGLTIDPVADASLGGATVNHDAGTARTFDYGPVQDDITTVELAWSDGHRETVEVDNGWWLAVRELTDITVVDNWELPHVTSMVFVDASGTKAVGELAQ